MQPAEPAQVPVPRDLVDVERRHKDAVAGGLVAAAVALVVGFVATAVVDAASAVGVFVAGFAVAAFFFVVVYAVRLAAPVVVDDRARAAARAFFFFAVALVLPLALHGALRVWEWAPYVDIAVHRNHTFAGWVRATIIYVPHTHIIFAALWALRAFRGTRKPSLRVIAVASIVATACDAFLWNFYAVLPTGYVAVSLLVLLPAMCWLERRFSDEA